MKLTVVHNVFQYNPYIAESLLLNLMALEKSNVPYQYILFNDHGAEEIFEDVKDIVYKYNVEYIYADINYGRKMCHGGWIGALPYVKGDILHIADHDDIMTSLFYEKSYSALVSNPDIMFSTATGIVTTEELKFVEFTLNLHYLNFSFNTPQQSYKTFKNMLGVNSPDYEITRLFNPIISPGTIYKIKLHDLIGLPDLDNFGGIGDFEYWLRIFFNGYIGHYIDFPTYLYRQSKYSTTYAVIDGKPNVGYWDLLAHDILRKKYSKLIQENLERFL